MSWMTESPQSRISSADGSSISIYTRARGRARPSSPAVRGAGALRVLLLRCERRPLHLFNTAYIQVFRIGLVEKLEDQSIQAIDIGYTEWTVSGFGDDHVSAVRQI